MLANYLFCALAGTTWYFQFFFYTMGETQMGKYKFSSWTLHMASIIIFSSLWGIGLKEWKGAGPQAGWLLAFSPFLVSWDQLWSATEIIWDWRSRVERLCGRGRTRPRLCAKKQDVGESHRDDLIISRKPTTADTNPAGALRFLFLPTLSEIPPGQIRGNDME